VSDWKSRLTPALVAAVLAVVTGVDRVAAQDTPSSTGLELANPMEIMLTVRAGSHATKHGLTPQLLRSRIGAKLDEAGLRHTNFAASARLEVQADCDSTGAFFSLAFNFHRPVSYEAGKRSYRSTAITWDRAILGSFNQQTNIVLAVAERLAEEFVADHKKANPVSTLRGKVTAADAKFQFVVINIGAEAGVKPQQEFTVERNGEAIAQVRITTVNADHAIGNILQTPAPAGEVLEGDEVAPRR
jgi:hypothetical protein